ncbi:MAG: pyridoxamine 5'-phosphate oxidase family protein [bacterium]|nr:pyridoxamine 5'-phosphate oxidase family protein [bacterium]
MDEVKDLVQMILEKGYLMSLATVDEGGPWVSDIIYVADGFTLYWLSHVNTRHSQAIFKNPKVAASITLTTSPSEDDIGLQLEGKAEKIEGDILEIAKKHRLKRGKPAPTREGEILDPEESWYKFTPTKIELIYEPKWGFKKQVLEL